MKSPLGMVTVAAVTVVKVAAIVGAAVAGYYLAGAALAIWAGGGGDAYALAGRYTLGFLAGVAGFELAEWTGGKLKVIEAKEQQQAMLRKLEAQHGVGL